MEKTLKKIDEYTNRWKIKINGDKMEVISFGKKRLGTIKLKWKTKVVRIRKNGTYLGITIDNQLKMNLHTTTRGAVARKKIRCYSRY